jgi:DNA-binding beta-propeller fold protein YncE
MSIFAASSRAINRTVKSKFNRRYDLSVCGLNFAGLCAIALVHSFWTVGIMMAGSTTASNYELKPLSLPGATGVVTLDYFAYDRSTGKLWVPASNTGNVDVIDENSDAVSQVAGFKTGEVELRVRKVTLGPTAVSVGDGVVYIGNRGDSTLCIIDAHTLERGACLQVAPASAGPAAAPDGVVYIAATRELWITTGAPPLGITSADKSIQVFDASDPRRLKPKTKIPLNGSAEGYAVDNQRGFFYTNVEETGKTVAIDVRSHKLAATWNPGSTELQGLALDSARGFLLVACGDHVVSLDVGHSGAITDSIQTGPGLDNIDYSPERKVLYAAASLAATLTIADVDDHGKFHLNATVTTIKGARGVVAGKGGTAYMIDPAEGRILKLTHK